MTNKTKRGGVRGPGSIVIVLAVAIALIASLFSTTQEAQAITPSSDVAVVTLSAPEECESPFWEFVNYAGDAHVADPHERTTLGYVFEPGHHFFRVTCDHDLVYRFGVTGPTTNAGDAEEEMRWTHRASKCRGCEVIVYHPAFIAGDLPTQGYRDPVSWNTWLAEAEARGLDDDIDLVLLTKLAERGLVGTAAIIIEPSDEVGNGINAVRVQVSHINF